MPSERPDIRPGDVIEPTAYHPRVSAGRRGVVDLVAWVEQYQRWVVRAEFKRVKRAGQPPIMITLPAEDVRVCQRPTPHA